MCPSGPTSDPPPQKAAPGHGELGPGGWSVDLGAVVDAVVAEDGVGGPDGEGAAAGRRAGGMSEGGGEGGSG